MVYIFLLQSLKVFIAKFLRIYWSIICIVHKLNSRNADAAITMMEIKSIFKDTKKMSKIVEIVIPRYTLIFNNSFDSKWLNYNIEVKYLVLL